MSAIELNGVWFAYDDSDLEITIEAEYGCLIKCIPKNDIDKLKKFLDDNWPSET